MESACSSATQGAGVPGKEEEEGKEQTPLPPPPWSNRWAHCIKDTRIWIQKIWMEEEMSQQGNSTQRQPLDPVALSGNSGPATHQLGYLRSILTPKFHLLISQMGLTHTSQDCTLYRRR